LEDLVARYRKKPIVVEAQPFAPGLEDGVDSMELTEENWDLLVAWYGDAARLAPRQETQQPAPEPQTADGAESQGENKAGAAVELELREPKKQYQVPFINTLEGKRYILPTDMMVTGISGERYPMKKDIFERSYELAPDGALPKELAAAEAHLVKAEQDYHALGRFIMPIRNALGGLRDRWDKGERTKLICDEILAVTVPQA